MGSFRHDLDLQTLANHESIILNIEYDFLGDLSIFLEKFHMPHRNHGYFQVKKIFTV